MSPETYESKTHLHATSGEDSIYSYSTASSCPLTSDLSSKILHVFDLQRLLFPVHATTVYRGSRSIAPVILSFGTIWRWRVTFTSRPLYPQERRSVPIEMDPGCVPEEVKTFEEEKSQLPLPGFEPLIVQTCSRGKFQNSSYWVRQAYMLVRMQRRGKYEINGH